MARQLTRLMAAAALVFAVSVAGPAGAAEDLPWGGTTSDGSGVITPDNVPRDNGDDTYRDYDPRYDGDARPRDDRHYRTQGDRFSSDYGGADEPYPQPYDGPLPDEDVRSGEGAPSTYSRSRRYREPPPDEDYRRYREPPGDGYARRHDEYDNARHRRDRTFSAEEISDVGRRFFGKVSSGLARVIEHAFAEAGRPNGYVLGEEAGGAFVAGLRYGEGTLYTRDAGRHKVYWQGPTLGYDFGAEGSKTMILVYNMRHPADIYHRFGGVDGSAYFVGGVGITFQSYGHMKLAPIRAGVGLRLGANVGYLKYSRRPTWNPF